MRAAGKFAVAVVLLLLVMAPAAYAQATRTWVSGTGDDANPCSRTAPCKTFAGAISRTAAGGEINVLDPGGFGAVTITKSITIKSNGALAGVLVSGTNGIVVAAGAGDHVTLVGLDFNGLGNSLCGVDVITAGLVTVMNDEISGFRDGVCIVPNGASAKAVITHSHIHQNGIGVFAGPTSGGIFASATLRYDDIQDNTCGASASSFGPNNTPPDASSACGAAGSGSGINTTAAISAFHTGFNLNSGAGVFARGNFGVVTIGGNDITSNGVGVQYMDSGVVRSYGNNMIADNGSTSPPNATITTAARDHYARNHRSSRYLARARRG